MTDIFTASNGVTLQPRETLIDWSTEDLGGVLNFNIDTAVDDAMAEWYLHRRDTGLGRWRDPENSHMVVYPHSDNVVRVVNEKNGITWDVTRPLHLDDLDAPSWHGAAARYFAAHPEPKPWESAKHEEVWEITAHGDTGPALATTAHDYGSYLAFQVANGNLISTEVVTAGRRIWPPESDDE